MRPIIRVLGCMTLVYTSECEEWHEFTSDECSAK